jgi:hypothetical protein
VQDELIRNCTVDGNASLANGNGGHFVTIESTDSRACDFNGQLTIRSGRGPQSVTMTGVRVYGKAQVLSSAGNTSALVQSAAGRQTIFGSALTIRSGLGLDSVTLKDGMFAGWVTLFVSIGGSAISVSGSTFGNNLEVRAFAGADTVQLASSSIARRFLISTGDGDDTLRIDNTQFGDKIDVQFGRGNDALLIQGQPTVLDRGTSFFNGGRVLMGAGTDVLAIGVSDNVVRLATSTSLLFIKGGIGLGTVGLFDGFDGFGALGCGSLLRPFGGGLAFGSCVAFGTGLQPAGLRF